MISIENILEILPKRSIDAHKGSCGRIGIIAGSSYMAGAAILAATAAYRSGVGLVNILTEKRAARVIHSALPEAIVQPLSSEHGWIHAEAISEALHAYESNNWDCVIIGPGLGRDDSTQLFVRGLISEFQELSVPLIIDADALNALDKTYLTKHSFENCVFTPHFGEFVRLTGEDVLFDQANEVADSFAQTYGGILCLKSHNTVVTDGYESFRNETGNAGMATAGMGDVLTGIIASIYSQSDISLLNATVLAVYVHGLAGDKAYSIHGNGLIATDVADNVGRVLLELEAQGIA